MNLRKYKTGTYVTHGIYATQKHQKASIDLLKFELKNIKNL